MFAYCLVDLFNLDLWPRHREPNEADIRDGIWEIALCILAEMTTKGVAPRELTLRLYGGWNGALPNGRDNYLGRTSAAIRSLPRSWRTRLRYEIADTPASHRSLPLLNTVRMVGLREVRCLVTVPSNCTNTALCAVHHLSSWLNGHCPADDCPACLVDAVTTTRQKMVDTLLVADAAFLASSGEADMVAVVCDDDDAIPSLLAARAAGCGAMHFRRQLPRNTYYVDELERLGISTAIW